MTLRRFFAPAACALLASACASAPPSGQAPAPVTRVWTPESPPGQIARDISRDCRRPRENGGGCVERSLVLLVGQVGVGRAMQVLDTLMAAYADVRQGGHELAHGMGLAAYRGPQTLAATFAECPAAQGGGCYHGVVQGYFLALAHPPGTAELDTLCEPHRENPFLYFQCAHGTGHGLMAVHGNHVPMSLQACDLASSPFVRESCYGGVFMENLVLVTHPHNTTGGHAATQEAGHGGHHADGGHGEWKALDRDDPLYPCNAVDARYQPSCYTMQTGAILFFNGGNIAGAGRACEGAPEAMVPICFGSLGRDVIAFAQMDHRRTLRLCARAAGMAGGRGGAWCMVGAVQNLMNLAADPGEGMRFCRAVPADDEKQACYRAVGEIVYSLVRTDAERGGWCQAAEPAFVAVCRRGAALDPPPVNSN